MARRHAVLVTALIAMSGLVPIAVSGAAASAASGASAPVITKLTPPAGTTSGGRQVVIYGNHFTHITAVRFGGSVTRHFSVTSSTTLSVISPGHPAGLVGVRVVTDHGTSPTTVADHYTYGPVPGVSNVNPNAGVLKAGTRVAITGSHFTAGSVVHFGGGVGLDASVQSATRLLVTAPGHAAGPVHVTVTNPFGTSPQTAIFRYADPTGPVGLNWSPRVVIDPAHSDLQSVSCADGGFCVTTDAGGATYVHTAHGWTRSADGLGASETQALSCPSRTFCMAVEGDSSAVYDGSRWSAPAVIDPGHLLASVSCPTTNFCLAVDDGGNALTYTVSTWNPPASVATGSLYKVACASPSYCVALTRTGDDAITYDGRTWGSPTTAVAGGAGLDCPAVHFCVAVGRGEAAILTQAGWQAPTTLSPDVDYTAVSCSGPDRCTVPGDDGHTWVLTNRASWTESTPEHAPAVKGIACPTSTSCVAVGGADASVYSGSSWAAEQVIDPGTSGQINAMSCPTYRFCAAVDDSGFAFEWNGSTWTRPILLDLDTQGTSASSLESISCTGPTFCLAVSASGKSFTFDGTRWSSASVVVRFDSVSSVSCTSSTFCMAIDNSGRAFVFDGTAWSTLGTIDANGNGLYGLSCASPSFCVAIDGDGSVVTWQGHSWSDPARIDDTLELEGVSCPSASSCVVVDRSGGTVRWNGTTWTSSVAPSDGKALIRVACGSATSCQTFDYTGSVYGLHGDDATDGTDIATSYDLRGIACATPAVCLAFDDGGVFVGRL